MGKTWGAFTGWRWCRRRKVKALAKPMLSAALDALRARGYNAAWLWTGTGRIAALNLYLHFGFVPHPRDEAEREAWRAVAPHLKYPVIV